MPTTHYTGAAESIDHGDASALFPVESLSAEVHQFRDAQLRLDAADSEDTLIVSPTGFGSGYFLGQHPLTVVEIRSLSPEVRTSIAEQSDIDIGEFEIIQIGRATDEIVNRSLAEFC